MSDITAPEWLTIGEAAARFAVAPRTLRRAIERCQNEAGNAANGDTNAVTTRQVTRRTKTGNRSATAYPFSLVERLAGEIRGTDDGADPTVTTDIDAAETGQTVTVEGAANGSNSDKYSDSNGANADKRGSPDAALIAQLQSENARLWESLKASQENERAALAQLADARRESQVMISAVATGRLQLPAQETGTMTTSLAEPTKPETAQTSATVAQSGQDTHAGGQSAAPSKSEQENARPWWHFWRNERW